MPKKPGCTPYGTDVISPLERPSIFCPASLPASRQLLHKVPGQCLHQKHPRCAETIHPARLTAGSPTRWAPSSYKWSYNPYKWPNKWLTVLITLVIGVINPVITGMGPTLYKSPMKGKEDDTSQAAWGHGTQPLIFRGVNFGRKGRLFEWQKTLGDFSPMYIHGTRRITYMKTRFFKAFMQANIPCI